VVGNFLHHIDPYGVVLYAGAFTLVKGNVFYFIQNHSIATDGAKTSGYLAYDNLMLSRTGSTDIDVHGSLCVHHWGGGIAGSYFDVGWNTVLQTDAMSFFQRGSPCLRTDIHHNIFRHKTESEAIGARTFDSANRFKRWANTFNVNDALADHGVGDFDGDGIADVFVGTGAAWFFSSGGQAEWRFLNRMPERASALRFGDFDGDGRTDVLALHQGRIVISWAGCSPWQPVNVTAWKLSDMAVGDFDGDRHADLLLATGAEWFVAPGARNWAPYSAQPHRTPDLRFGDFNKDGKTDVVGVVGGRWKIMTTHSGAGRWEDLHPSLKGTLAGVVVADFTGDGIADLARSSGEWWWISKSGRAPWEKLRSAQVPGLGRIVDLTRFPIGRFYDGNATADIVFWSGATGLHFDFAPGGRDPITRLSRQDMK
jgi:hypothetical protein